MLPEIRKITTKEEYQATINAARMDNDALHFPTHMLYKDGKIVGGWSLEGIPIALVWHDTKAITSRDSLMLSNTIDTIMNDRGHKSFLQACNSNSPYNKYMEKHFGYKTVWPTNLFVKNVEGPSELLKGE
mgnify:CR=1 FL=1